MSHTPWDELDHPLKKKVYATPVIPVAVPVDEEVDENVKIQNEVKSIGKRMMFGALTGALTGASFGVIDVLRDPKMMIAQKRTATSKILRYSTYFGGFFSIYHGLRRTLHLYYPQPLEYNIATSAVISLIPVVTVGKYRNLFPYAAMMIALDTFNSFTEA